MQGQKRKELAMRRGGEVRARALIHGRAVSCELPKSGRPRDFPARCNVAGTDLSTWVVREGWAVPADPPPALAEAADAAKKDGVGLWRGGDDRPEAKAQ